MGRCHNFSILFVLLLIACLGACSPRPKAHHPQPEDNKKQEAELVTNDLLDACKTSDQQRFFSYLDKNLTCLALGTEVERISTQTLASRFNESERVSAACAPNYLPAQLKITAYSRFELLNRKSDVPETIREYSLHMQKWDILVAVTHRSGKNTNASPLIVIWSKPAGAWLINAADCDRLFVDE